MSKLGLESIRTTKMATLTSVLDTYLVPIFTSTNAKPQLTTVANFNAGGVIDSNNVWTGTNGFDDTVSIGKSGTAGDIKIYPSTASKGYVTITADDQTGDTAVDINVNAMGQATVVNLDDPGIAASHLVQSTAQVTIAEADTLSGILATTEEINSMCDASTRVVASVDPTTLEITSALHANKIIYLTDLDGAALTLPAATGTGDIFMVMIAATITSNTTTIKAASSADSFLGMAFGVDDDADAGYAWKAESADDTVTLDGSATGGKAGDWFKFTDVATGLFLVESNITQSGGSEATPFSATVN